MVYQEKVLWFLNEEEFKQEGQQKLIEKLSEILSTFKFFKERNIKKM